MPNGEKVNGWTKYNTQVRSYATICISKKSDDIRRTFKHEFEHASLNAVGEEALIYNE
jgi:hypothetical protein